MCLCHISLTYLRCSQTHNGVCVWQFLLCSFITVKRVAAPNIYVMCIILLMYMFCFLFSSFGECSKSQECHRANFIATYQKMKIFYKPSEISVGIIVPLVKMMSHRLLLPLFSTICKSFNCYNSKIFCRMV